MSKEELELFVEELTRQIDQQAADNARLREALESFLREFEDFRRWPTGKGYAMSESALAVYEQAHAALSGGDEYRTRQMSTITGQLTRDEVRKLAGGAGGGS